MGGAIMRRLTGGGWTVAAHDRDGGRESSARAAGSRWFEHPEDLVRWADVLLTVLPDGTVVHDAVTDAVLQHAQLGLLWIDLTSGAPDLTRTSVARASGHGVAFVSAPIGGSPEDAQRGDLRLFVSGPSAARARARPLLEVLASGEGVREVGDDPADGQTVKLLVNALWFTSALATSEALLIAQQAGISPEHLGAILPGTAGASAFSDRHLARFLAGDDLTTFGIDGIVLELQSVRRAGGGLHTPVLDASLVQHEAALDRFGPALGELLAVRLLELQNERSLRSD